METSPLVAEVIARLQKEASPERAAVTQRFFKTEEHAYSADDQFIGIRVPLLRSMVKEYRESTLLEISTLLQSPIHEQRHLALLMMVAQYQSPKTPLQTKECIYQTYLQNAQWINNWDLVDCSTPHILGEHLRTRDRGILYQWVQSKNLWQRRMSIVATWAFIKNGDLEDTFTLATHLLLDREDLIHKAVGWMLREAGKRDQVALRRYLAIHHTKMPRTMLRYSIENFSAEERAEYLSK